MNYEELASRDPWPAHVQNGIIVFVSFFSFFPIEVFLPSRLLNVVVQI